jgi:hypothetical protein
VELLFGHPIKKRRREKECDRGLSNISVEKIMTGYLNSPHIIEDLIFK